jgi:hypothetical protein
MRTVLLALLLVWPSLADAQDRLFTDILLGSYVVAGFTDTAQTSFCLGARTCREANPAMRWAIETGSVPIAMTAKGALHVGITSLLLRHRDAHPRRVRWVAATLAAMQFAVVAQNVRAVRSTHRRGP